MKRAFVLLFVVSTVTGCHSANQDSAPKEKQDSAAAPFPVSAFIEGQIHLVDSFQLPTLKYITVYDKTDSSLISINEFKQLAQEFLHPAVDDTSSGMKYKESSFADQSVKGVTFTYAAANKDQELQRVDVLVSASAVANDKVRSIYMEKQTVSGDTTVYKKLYWRTDKNFQIITTKQLGKQPSLTSIMKVEWDRD